MLNLCISTIQEIILKWLLRYEGGSEFVLLYLLSCIYGVVS